MVGEVALRYLVQEEHMCKIVFSCLPGYVLDLRTRQLRRAAEQHRLRAHAAFPLQQAAPRRHD
jgi:hypothetical protein